ncbi:MAG: Holliday junction resolvase RuvX [Betaproteobacteria bacterium]
MAGIHDPGAGGTRTSHDKSDPAGTVVAFDFGEKRIGVAVGDVEVGIAHPLATIEAEDSRSRFSAIAAIIEEWRPSMLVVGVPFHGKDAKHELERLARRFSRRLEGRFGIATRLVDERLTSHAAEAALREQGLRRRKIKAALDEAAAQHILQAYFEALRTQRAAGTAHELW